MKFRGRERVFVPLLFYCVPECSKQHNAHRGVRPPSHTVVMSQPPRRTQRAAYFSLLDVSLEEEVSGLAVPDLLSGEEAGGEPFPLEAPVLGAFLA